MSTLRSSWGINHSKAHQKLWFMVIFSELTTRVQEQNHFGNELKFALYGSQLIGLIDHYALTDKLYCCISWTTRHMGSNSVPGARTCVGMHSSHSQSVVFLAILSILIAFYCVFNLSWSMFSRFYLDSSRERLLEAIFGLNWKENNRLAVWWMHAHACTGTQT